MSGQNEITTQHHWPNPSCLTNSPQRSLTKVSSALAGMAVLQFLDLDSNLLTGRLDSACNLTATGLLQQLSLANNRLQVSNEHRVFVPVPEMS